MSKTLDPSALDTNQLYVVGFLCQLKEWGRDAVNVLPVSDRLRRPPYAVTDDAFALLLEGLVAEGWIVATEAEGDGSIHGLSEAACGAMDAVGSRLRERPDLLPEDDAATLLCADALEDADGFGRDDVRRCLEEPPMSLSRDEGRHIHDVLRDADWIFIVDREEREPLWFPSPYLWARKAEVVARVEGMQDRIRSRLAESVAEYLELAKDSALRRALRDADRAHHVDESLRLRAYRHAPVPIPRGGEEARSSTSAPVVCATIVKVLDLKPGDRVLICGVKGGFTASLAAHVVGPKGRVVCLEDDEIIADFARQALARAGHDPQRVEVRLVEDVTIGHEQGGPWDAVVLNGNVPKIPLEIIEQVHDGGCLLVFLHNKERNAQDAQLIRKNRGIVAAEELASFIFTPIFGRYGWDRLEQLQDDYQKAREGRAQRDLLDSIDRKIAYPFARSYDAASSSGDPHETHSRVLDAYECLIKLLTIPLCAIRDARAEQGNRGSEYVARLLGRPTLGHWAAALRQLSQESGGHPHADQLASDLNRPLRGSHVLNAMRMMRRARHLSEFGEERVTPSALLESIVAYRNMIAHGSVPSKRDTEERSETLLNALGELVLSFDVLKQWELFYVRSVESTRAGTKIDAKRLVGNKAVREPNLSPPSNPEVKTMSNMVILRDVRSGVWIDLHPWMVWTVGDREEELFLYHRREGKQAHYRTYHNSDRYPQETEDDFSGIQERHLVESSGLVNVLDTVLEDERITLDEMRLLSLSAIKARLADSDETAKAYIITLARERLPGVIIDGVDS